MKHVFLIRELFCMSFYQLHLFAVHWLFFMPNLIVKFILIKQTSEVSQSTAEVISFLYLVLHIKKGRLATLYSIS